MKQYFPACILPVLLLFACSDHVQVVNSPGPQTDQQPRYAECSCSWGSIPVMPPGRGNTCLPVT